MAGSRFHLHVAETIVGVTGRQVDRGPYNEKINEYAYSACHPGRGYSVRAQLESAIVIDGITAVPRGAFVHDRIVQAKQGGRAVGSSEMAIEFTDLMINDQLFEIATEGMQAQTGNEARNTLGRTARAAAIGGLISGSSGARTGAAVGAQVLRC